MILPIIVLIISFAFLFRFANYLVDGAISLARITRTPKFVIGVIILGFGTTAPELAVSVIASFLGHSEIAIGNAVGSIICDDALALGLAALVAPAAIAVSPTLLKEVGLFIIGVDLLAYALIFNGYIGRRGGGLLLAILFVYYAFVCLREKKRKTREPAPVPTGEGAALKKTIIILVAGIVGVVIASRGVVWSAVKLTEVFGISSAVVGFTIVAIGTSLPEISTCLTAGFRGEGDIAVGNILGADILNVLWIIGMSAVVNPITVGPDIIHFAFPWMIGVVAVTLLFLRYRYRIGRVKGGLLVGIYCVYMVWTVVKFY